MVKGGAPASDCVQRRILKSNSLRRLDVRALGRTSRPAARVRSTIVQDPSLSLGYLVIDLSHGEDRLNEAAAHPYATHLN